MNCDNTRCDYLLQDSKQCNIDSEDKPCQVESVETPQEDSEE